MEASVIETALITGDPVISRRTAIGATGATLGGLLLFPGRAMANQSDACDDSFVVLLKGFYQPVVHAPKLGLSSVNLSDDYFTTKIYPVRGTRGGSNPKKPIGDFYAKTTAELCAYRIPGGSFSMRFTDSDYVLRDDGHGGQILDGTFELTVVEGTGVYRSLVGGHNHMVDLLHYPAEGGADEYCFCFISQP